VDLRLYYSKIREVESTLDTPYVVVVSMATSDGGKAGVLTETTRHQAAKQIAEGKARPATEDESLEFHSANASKKRDQEEFEAMNRVQFVVMPQKHSSKPAKE